MSQPPSSPDDPTQAGASPYGAPPPQNSPYQQPSYPDPPTHQPYGGGDQNPYGGGQGYQQPGYDQGGYQQPGYQQGYGQAPYGGSPYTPPKKKSSGGKTALWVVLGIVVVILVVCGLGIFFIVRVANDVSSSIDDGDGPGTNGNPITITEGEEFDIEDISFDSGWQITGDDYSSEITGLVATNDGDTADNVSLTFTFLDGNSEVGEINCYSDGDIQDGNNEELSCNGSKVGSYQDIEVENTYSF